MIESLLPPDAAERDRWVRTAARNNASWCEAVCRAHGTPGAFAEEMWASARRTPPLYPDAVTLTPHTAGADLLARIDTASPGCSVKDSFACLDLTGAGFEVLFEAEWIYRPATLAAPAPVDGVRWDVVPDAEALAGWAAAWGADGNGPFRSELLADEGTFFLRGRNGDAVVAGAVASRSESVVGLSNVFAADGEARAAWAGVLAAVAERWPGLPVVGYESGDDLTAAADEGCLPIGPLRVWWQAG
ncbi:hypothetical protein [Streptomyces celluloflavus]|uniref:hypothetical protein n=1 Tax=Streptomyces celluloflavus TaxID=58344 RepID=UPI0036D14F59